MSFIIFCTVCSFIPFILQNYSNITTFWAHFGHFTAHSNSNRYVFTFTSLNWLPLFLSQLVANPTESCNFVFPSFTFAKIFTLPIKLISEGQRGAGARSLASSLDRLAGWLVGWSVAICNAGQRTQASC